MKTFGLKNCVISGCFTACLSLLLLLLLFLLAGNLIFKKIFNSGTEFGFDRIGKSKKETNFVPNSHLHPIDEEIVLRVALISDTENNWDALSDALDLIKSQDIKYVIHTGDITSFGVKSDLQRVKDMVLERGLELLPVPGDRDIYKSGKKSGDKANFQDVYGDAYYTKEVEGIHMLFIDNSNEYGGIDPEQWGFIEANIDMAYFVFLHNPIYFTDTLFGSKGMGQYSEYVNEQRKDLLVLVRNSDVVAVFAGDQHLFSEVSDAEDAGLNHYVVGSLSDERNLELPNFAILNIYKNNDYFVEKITL